MQGVIYFLTLLFACGVPPSSFFFFKKLFEFFFLRFTIIYIVLCCRVDMVFLFLCFLKKKIKAQAF